MSRYVWVLTIDYTGPDPGDYTGHLSAHATPDGAQNRLWQHVEALGLLDDVQASWTAVADDGCNAADVYTDCGTLHYGISRLEVEQ